MGQMKKKVSVSEKEKRLRYRYWTLVLVPDTETWFLLYSKLHNDPSVLQMRHMRVVLLFEDH